MPTHRNGLRLILDCDPGQDDAVALAVAAYFGDLVGITTVGGNAPLIDVTRNALLATQVMGLSVEVHAGSPRPLIAEPLHAPHIHGVSGFDGPSLPVLERSVASHDAVEYLIETVRAEEGIWLVPTGPLTNIALAFRAAPDLVDRVAGVSFMGGSATVGNQTPFGEFNIVADPEAAAIVLGSGAPLQMAGLDLTHQFIVDDDLIGEIRALDGSTPNPTAVMLADLMAGYLDRIEGLVGSRRGALHDPCAVLAVTHPEVIETTLRHVTVELVGTETRGMTVVDQRRTAPAELANVAHGHTLDASAARKLMVEAIASFGS